MSVKEARLDDLEDDFVGISADDGSEELDIVIEDDAPEEDRGRPIASPDTQDDESDDEMAEYSEAVQKRIRRQTAKTHDERRAKEVAYREKDAAVAFARQVHEQNQVLQAALAKTQASSLGEIKKGAQQEVERYKEDLRAAVELNDGDKVADLTVKLQEANLRFMNASSEEERIKSLPPPQPQPQPQPQAPRLSSKQQEWEDKNPWFRSNQRMFAYALAVHDELTKPQHLGGKGVVPETDLYYTTIDKEMRDRFPEAFKTSQSSGRSRSTPVAGVSRQAPSSSGKILKLTKAEASIASQLGISPKEYARQKMLLESER